MKSFVAALGFYAALMSAGPLFASEPAAPDYATQIAPIFESYCNACHSADDPEGKLALDSFAGLMRGGDGGASVVPGKADASRLIRVLEKQAEPFMPPEGSEGPTADEIALLKAWIAAGAKGPTDDTPRPRELVTPKIEPVGPVRKAVHALAYSPDGKWIAVGGYRQVELLAGDGKPARVLDGLAGHVNAVGFSADGKTLFAAAGEPGLFGEVVLWNTADWQRTHTLRGHRDSLYAAALSPDGTVLATGSYDHSIRLWRIGGQKSEVRSQKSEVRGQKSEVRGQKSEVRGQKSEVRNQKSEVRGQEAGDRGQKGGDDSPLTTHHSPPTTHHSPQTTDHGPRTTDLLGHNGPVFDLAFHPGGKLLASAGGDDTVKLWDVATGERLDTLVEPEKPQYAVAFSPDGRFLVAGGVDNRIRVWEVRGMGKEGTSPLVWSRFAHEEAILKLVFSPSGRTLVSSGEDHALKFWETGQFTQRRAVGKQSDWPAALAVAPDGRTLMVGRLDGTVSTYPLAAGEGEQVELPQPIVSIPLPEPHQREPLDKLPEVTEAEPNELPEQATPMSAPGIAHGVLKPAQGKSQDVDHFRFEAQAGQTWVIETNAARQKSPADTKIEILHADGTPVLRYLLQAVRDSYIEFRPIDSSQDQVRVKNWEEMDLNEFLYMNGEVTRLFRAPEGPDSGFQFYTVGGKRRCYFDTSATVHAVEDPVYIVEAFLPGTTLVDNGLPVFPLYYANDDDGDRKLGTDSQLTFTAPDDGTYLVRVTDVRGFGGDDYKYSLTIREPRPDFNVSIGGKGATIGAGSGQRLTFTLDRIDNFEGEVRIDIAGLPEGFSVSTPITVEAGHLQARGSLTAAADATAPPAEAWKNVKITATADIHGKEVTKDLGDLGEIKLADKPKLLIALETDPQSSPSLGKSSPSLGKSSPPLTKGGPGGVEQPQDDSPSADAESPPPAPPYEGGEPGELVIAPGTTITCLLKIERNGADGPIRFDIENLPHGIIVDNLGLNGITLLPGQTERRLHLTARDRVPGTSRLIHAVSRGEGEQTSRPIRLHVRSQHVP